MSSLEDNLRAILFTVSCRAYKYGKADGYEEGIDSISEPFVDIVKQAFTDEGYITPENAKKTQELVNQMANLAQDMAKLPVTIHECVHASGDWMTGQEWYSQYKTELDKLRSPSGYLKTAKDYELAAKRAAGLV